MSDSIMDAIAGYYRLTHEQVLRLLDRLDEQQITWRPNLTTLSIGFHVWHLARWADYLQEMLTDDGQIWEAEELAALWGLGGACLGFAETGMGMSDDASASLPLPGKDALLDYARRAFVAAEQAVAAIGDDEFHRLVQDRHESVGKEGAIGDIILNWWKHDNRHLGMIECMLGAQGLHGTATR
jgi:DinB superfamily